MGLVQGRATPAPHYFKKSSLLLQSQYLAPYGATDPSPSPLTLPMVNQWSEMFYAKLFCPRLWHPNNINRSDCAASRKRKIQSLGNLVNTKPAASSLANETTSNEYNPFAEATVCWTVWSRRHVLLGKHCYLGTVRKAHWNEDSQMQHTQARSSS